MDDRTLLRSQRNEVLQAIKRHALDPFNFQWSEVRSSRSLDSLSLQDTVSRLSYGDSKFYFLFDFLKGKHFAEFSPGRETNIQREYPGEWAGQLVYASHWLDCLEREVSEPDLWDQLLQYKVPEVDRLSSETTNAPFSVAEVAQIAAGIDKIRSYLEDQFEAGSEQFGPVNEKLDYLVGAAKRQGRKDWFHTAIGVLVTVAVTLALSQEQASTVWGILRSALAGVIRMLPGR